MSKDAKERQDKLSRKGLYEHHFQSDSSKYDGEEVENIGCLCKKQPCEKNRCLSFTEGDDEKLSINDKVNYICNST